jgi:hypothetical protein
MVEQEVEEFDQTVANEWARVSAGQAQIREFLAGSQRKRLDDSNYMAFFNLKLDINRFFIADNNTTGATPEDSSMPAIESGSRDPNDPEGGDPFENSLEDALCVFKSGGGDADILKDNESQILFYIDLENEAIIEKDKKVENNDADQEVEGTNHPLMIN